MTHVSLGYGSGQQPVVRKRPRIWAGVVLVGVMWCIMKIPGWIAPGSMAHVMSWMWAPIFGVVAVLIWWVAASRLAWATRWVGLGAFFLGGVIAFGLGDKSMRMGFTLVAMPLVLTVWVFWTVIGSHLGTRTLRLGLALLIVGTWSVFTLLRFDGLTGSLGSDVSFRWSQTAEERYLASRKASAHAPSQGPVASATTLPASGPTTGPISGSTTEPTTEPSASPSTSLAAGDWPGFRGPNRDGQFTGETIRTDWAQRPPTLLWKHLVGPGWGSFCVIGDLAYTQEQHGPFESVVCYGASTGEEAWSHDDQTRFTENLSGAGPRSTPTFWEGKLYSFGANGRLNCLDALSGNVIWSHDVMAESGATLPMWGFTSSPLVADGLVMVITGAKGKSLMAYKADTGTLAWAAGDGWGYGSPQVSRIGGIDVALYLTADGITGVNPFGGDVLFQAPFTVPGGINRAIQPTMVGDGEMLIGTAFRIGTKRVAIQREGSQWSTREVWMSRSIMPYYNDPVVYQGNIYGFDGNGSVSFVCVDAATGQLRWRQKGYGAGQVLLLANQGLLLIMAESGEAVLVEATPDAHKVVGRFQALAGKTWNHPVISHGKLFVRNSEEAAAYDLK